MSRGICSPEGVVSGVPLQPGTYTFQVVVTDSSDLEEDSAKVRAAAQSVSDPAIKEDLDSWADGFALLGQVIRDDAQRSSPKGPTGEAERIHQAGDLIYLTADKLRAVCPDAFPGRR